MADANNKLRLQIVSELDAAGIKATKDQVDQLELSLRRVGNSGADSGQKFGQLEKALGNLPGPIGKIGGALGGLAGQATLVVGAFSTGFAIGEKLREWAIAAHDWATGITEAREAAAFATQQNKELAAAAESAAQRQISLAAKRIASEAENVRMIDAETAAYFRQVSSLEGLKKAKGNAEMMQLERAKFEDMNAYSSAGNPEAAEQVGRYYDVLKEELAAKQQLEAFDVESLKISKDREAAELQAAKAVERTNAAEERLNKEKEKLASIDRHENGARGGMYAKLRAPQLKLVEAAQRDYDRAVEAENRRAEKLQSLDALDLQRKLDRANLAASGSLSVDRAAAAYDDFVINNGNPLNADIDQAWAADLLKSSVESSENQAAILEVVKHFSDVFERALTGGRD